MLGFRATRASGRLFRGWALVLCLLAVGLLRASPVPSNKPSHYPDWWFERDVIERLNPSNATPAWPVDYPVSDDFAAVLQGQFLNFSVAAYAEMRSGLYLAVWSTSEGQALTSLVESWDPQEMDAYVVINQGQAKEAVRRFYDVLIKAGYVQEYPWTTITSDDDSYAVVNIGNIKFLYNFDLTGFDTDLDGMPNDWETTHGLNTGEDSDAAEDSDGDGLTNLEEFQNGANPHATDTDYDGMSDSQEVADGTNPDDADSVAEMLLSKWRFETEDLEGEAGQAPKISTNNTLNNGWRGQGLDIAASEDSLLVYKDIESNGRPNITLRKGTIRLWIKPAWNSGEAPESWARIIENGTYSVDASIGIWNLNFNDDGTQIYFSTQDGNGNEANNIIKDISWTAGEWHELVLTFSPSETKLYVDGGNPTTGSGVTYLLPAEVQAEGFSIGTNREGWERTHCVIDEVEFYNYPLSAEQIEWDYAEEMVPGADSNSNGLPDAWEMQQLGSLDESLWDDHDSDGIMNVDEYYLGLNPANPDTDWDGIGDSQEIFDGTNPDDFESHAERKLAHFTFDEANLAGPDNEEPRSAAGVEQVNGWRGKGVRINDVGDILSYERIRQDGSPNIALKKGSVRFWFKPEWPTQPTQMSGYESRLIQLGTSGSNTIAHWTLYLSQSEPRIHFSEGNGDNAAGISTNGPVAWAANQWVQIIITYTPENVKIYLNGNPSAVASLSHSYDFEPDLSDLDATGLMLGGDGSRPLKGIIDEVEFFNYELSTAEIHDAYVAASAGGSDSTDGDELPDGWEVQYFGDTSADPYVDDDTDGVTNRYEYQLGLNPKNPDTDWDGVSDSRELADGTEPGNFASVTPRKIAHFTFNEQDLVGPNNEPPRTATGIQQVNGWRGKGARLNDVGDMLAYERTRLDGAPNIALKRGSVRFWFKPEWATQPTQMSGYPSRLIQLGTTGNNALAHWALYLSQSEPKINFTEGNGDNAAGISTFGTVGWNSGDWVQVVMTYNAESIKIYLNGNSTAVASLTHSYPFEPDLTDLDATGLRFGSDGSNPLKGTIDEVEFFNYELSGTQIHDDYEAENVLGPDGDGDGMPDAWESTYGLDPNANDRLEDLDRDRIPNIFEYVHGTNPNSAASVPAATLTVDPAQGAADPEDAIFSTIQDALHRTAEYEWSEENQAYVFPNAYSIIFVKSDRYEENLAIYGAPVLLLGELGASSGPVEVRGVNPYGPTLGIFAETVVDGFVISHERHKDGPGVSTSDGWSDDDSGRRRLVNCIIRNNQFYWGSGIYNASPLLEVVHCTVIGNEAGGPAIYNAWQANLTLVNSVVWNPQAGSEIGSEEPGNVSIANSIVRGGDFGGIDVNPLVTPIGWLKSTSPARNRSGVILQKASLADLNGELRNGGTPDLGADEFVDGDADGLPDWMEAQGATTTSGDFDGDGLTNQSEYETHGTAANKDDTDGDELDDGDEVNTYQTDPNSQDSDGDGLSDRIEILVTLTLPLDADSDGDGYGDRLENDIGTDPSTPNSGSSDTDSDGLTLDEEIARGSDPYSADSDGDGVSDGDEVAQGTDPTNPDSNGDGIPDGEDIYLVGEMVNTTLPKYGFGEYEVTDSNKPKRYLTETRWDDLTPNPDTGQLVPVTAVEAIDPITGNGTTTSSVMLNNGSLLHPNMHVWPPITYQVDPMFKQEEGRVAQGSSSLAYCSWTLSSENTTEMLRTNTNDLLPVFQDQWSYQSRSAEIDMASDELSFLLSKLRYKWMIANPAAQADTTACWLEVFIPEEDPDTEVKESEKVEVLDVKTWKPGEPQGEQGYYEIKPFEINPTKDGTYRVCPVRISFQAVEGNEPITDNRDPVTGDWMPGRGKRIFPDAKDPDDHEPRNQIYVYVEVGIPNVEVKLRVLDVDDPSDDRIIDPNDKGTLKRGWDNMTYYSGTKIPKPPAFANNKQQTILCKTDQHGIARVGKEEGLPILEVGMQPGDNYRVVAGFGEKQNEVDKVQVTRNSSSRYLGFGDVHPDGFTGATSPMLTVWRKLNLEIDSMTSWQGDKSPYDRITTNSANGSPSGGEVWHQDDSSSSTLTLAYSLAAGSGFYKNGRIVSGNVSLEIKSNSSSAITVLHPKDPSGNRATSLTENQKNAFRTGAFEVFDDDDKYLTEFGLQSPPLPRNGEHAEIVSQIQSKFTQAYIKIEDATAREWNTSQTIDFYLNLSPSGLLGHPWIDARNLPISTSQFWTWLVIFGYQKQEPQDMDPDEENSLLGGTPYNFLTGERHGYSVIYLESVREDAIGGEILQDLQNPTIVSYYRNAYYATLLGTVAHEMGHGPSFQGEDQDHEEGGLMQEGALKIDSPGSEFRPVTIRRFRERTRW